MGLPSTQGSDFEACRLPRIFLGKEAVVAFSEISEALIGLEVFDDLVKRNATRIAEIQVCRRAHREVMPLFHADSEDRNFQMRVYEDHLVDAYFDHGVHLRVDGQPVSDLESGKIDYPGQLLTFRSWVEPILFIT